MGYRARNMFKWLPNTRFLASGGYGAVYQVCDLKGDCNYVMKIQESSNLKKRMKWEREVNMTKSLNSYNIGAKFVGAWFCQDDYVGIIISELWSGELLLDDDECLPDDLVDKLSNQVKVIHNLGLVHGDILPKNILIKRNTDGIIIDATITDFGSVSTTEDWKTNKDITSQIKTYYDYHNQFPNMSMFYTDNNITLKQVVEDPTLLDDALIYNLKTCIEYM